MTTQRPPKRYIRTSTAAVIAAMLIMSAPKQTLAQTSDCDCSCESYTRLMQVVETYEKRQKSGEPQGIPPEMMQMGICGGQCAMQWARCQNPDADLSGMEKALQQSQQGGRDHSGDDAIARERAINERSIGETEKNLEADATYLPAERLNGDYLDGTWCSVYGGQETTQWEFTGEGEYRLGIPAGRGYAMQPEIRDLEHFRDRFEHLIEQQRNTFTTEHRHGRKNVFTRGPCN